MVNREGASPHTHTSKTGRFGSEREYTLAEKLVCRFHFTVCVFSKSKNTASPELTGTLSLFNSPRSCNTHSGCSEQKVSNVKQLFKKKNQVSCSHLNTGRQATSFSVKIQQIFCSSCIKKQNFELIFLLLLLVGWCSTHTLCTCIRVSCSR